MFPIFAKFSLNYLSLEVVNQVQVHTWKSFDSYVEASTFRRISSVDEGWMVLQQLELVSVQGQSGNPGTFGGVGGTGRVGPVGFPGNQGWTGPVGQQGVRGGNGAPGFQGPSGPSGPQGAQGNWCFFYIISSLITLSGWKRHFFEWSKLWFDSLTNI